MRHNLVEMVKKPLITLHDGEYVKVSATKLQVCGIIENATGETFNLELHYTKGAEAGLNLYIAFPRDLQDTEPFPMELGFESIGGGVLRAADLLRQWVASTTPEGHIVPVQPNGRRYFTVYQQEEATAQTDPTGTFKLYADINSIAR